MRGVWHVSVVDEVTSSSSTVSSITVACPILCRAVCILLPNSANTILKGERGEEQPTRD